MTIRRQAAGRPRRGAGRRTPGEPRHQRGWVTWWRGDRGCVAAEVTVAAPVLVMLLVFIAVLIHRGVDARLRLEDAAHQAARAASVERTIPAAATAARSTAATALSAAGLACQSLHVETDASGLAPGGAVTVTLTCTVDLDDASILGVPGRKRLTATATEPVDTYRSTVNTLGGHP